MIKYKFQQISDIIVLFLTIYAPIIGLSWIVFHIYIRFGGSKTPYMLNDLKPFMTPYYYILMSAFILFHFGILITIMVALYRQKFNKLPSVFILFLSHPRVL